MAKSRHRGVPKSPMTDQYCCETLEEKKEGLSGMEYSKWRVSIPDNYFNNAGWLVKCPYCQRRTLIRV